ncbi:MAG: 4Fe-4S dicluster domain-containing protein [Acidimicrobiales bacterium]
MTSTRVRAGRVDRPRGEVPLGTFVVLGVDAFASLIATLKERGYDTKGPVVSSGAIVPGPIKDVDDLPRGVRDEQSPGHYGLIHTEGEKFFDWAVGPAGWKSEFFPPHEDLWHARIERRQVFLTENPTDPAPLAVVGARPCEVAALRVLDRVFIDDVRDPRYADRREGAFVAVVECGSPGATCFCSSMGTGPDAEEGADLILTELDNDHGHRFLARVGTTRGADVLASLHVEAASDEDLSARAAVLDGARQRMSRRLEVDGLASLLARNLEHPRWAEVAERCLSCGNCTLVCPTCFCSDVRDRTELNGDVVRQRTWASCFSEDHSYLHGGAVRPSTQSRYRQWMTHKLSTWWDQFDTSGCVGCGRCITWCPVGIDITEEAHAIAESDGATRVEVPGVRRVS